MTDNSGTELCLLSLDTMNEDTPSLSLDNAIRMGNLKAVTNWLATLETCDRHVEVNKVQYEYGVKSMYYSEKSQGTVLHLAACYHQTAIAKLLLDEGANPNKKDSRGRNALHAACSAPSGIDITEMVKMLIDRKCYSTEDDNHRTAFQYAVLHNHMEVIHIVQDKAIEMDPKRTIREGNLEAVINWLATLEPGDEKIVELNKVKYKYAVYNNYDVNFSRHSQGTVLHFAVSNYQTAIAMLLLDEGADPNKKDSQGWNALHIACLAAPGVNILEMVKLLLERQCSVNEGDKYQRTALHYAAVSNHPEVVKVLLENGADLEIKDESGNQPIHLAQDDKVIEALVDKNADCVNWLSISEAIRTGNAEVVIDWLSTLSPGDKKKTELNKPKYNYSRSFQGTVLHVAVFSNQTAIAKLLLDEGADPNVKTVNGWNALHVACILCRGVDISEMMKLLIERNCNINEAYGAMGTPLAEAVRFEHNKAVKILLKNHADVELSNALGEKPILMAARDGNYEYVVMNKMNN